MNRRLSALRLRLPRIEKKPKPVYVERWQDFAGIAKAPDLMDELHQLIQNIRGGHGVPEKHYRAGIDHDRDGLLERHGIMHLHLGGKDSDILVFLIQYRDRVVLLESNTHVHFRTQPAGKNILALNQSWLTNLEHDLSAATARAEQMKDEAARSGAKARSAEIARVIAAFRRKAGLEEGD